MDEAKVEIGGQWFYRGNRSNVWFATYREGGGLADRVPSICWPFLEEIARLKSTQRVPPTRISALSPGLQEHLASKKGSAQPEALSRDAIIEECADLADQKLDHYSGTECTYRGDVAEAIRELKSRKPEDK